VSKDLKEAKFYFNMMMSSTFLFVYVCVYVCLSTDLWSLVASPCCDFIANVKGSGVARSFLETEFNQIKCFHLKANIDLVTMKRKSSSYLNKHLIPEMQFPWTLLILQRR